MGRRVIFPGSFDPFTRGHESVVRTSLNLFDEVVVGIGVNSSKKYLFSVEERIEFIQRVFTDDAERVIVVSFNGLTVDYCKANDINFIIRGVRNNRDFDFENEIANMNRTLNANIETLFLSAKPEHSFINSTIVREIYRNGGDVSAFLPQGIELPKN